jgi:hypothetical protein
MRTTENSSPTIDMDQGEHAAELLDRWFASDTWEQICNDADSGDQDSIELMEQVSWHLTSLSFHLQNDSGQDRVLYEMQYFAQLCDDFEVE